MTVDHAGRVQVSKMVRRSTSDATLSLRKGHVKNLPPSGFLVAGHGDTLFIVTPDGLHRTSASRFDEPITLVQGHEAFFKDSQMGLDRTRFAHDGWVSVIGRSGKTVAVIDYWIGDSNK